jgi:bifunctional DNA-binding transcriptional regulator/antitoxin component of YhaV-PrlF toxin-antitoxin module
MREAAGIRPGDRVNVSVRPEGGVIVEAEAPRPTADAIEEKKPIIDRAVAALRPGEVDRTMAADDWMGLLRAED